MTRCASYGLLPLLLSLLLNVEARGQTSGEICLLLEIRSAESGQGLPGATVEIVSWRRGTAADVEGVARICGLRVDTLRLVVSSLGYESKEIELGPEERRGERVTVELEPLETEGATVVVFGHADEAGSSEAVLSGDLLQEKLGPTLAETLRGVGGVAVRSIGPAAAQPVVRGMSGDRVEVAENGVGTADASGFSADHATSLETIGLRRISVIRGPTAFLYSATPFGGVIDLERRAPDGEGFLSGGITSSYRTVSRGGALGGGITLRPRRDLDVELEGSYRNNGDLRTPALTIPKTDLLTTQFGAGLSWSHDSLRLNGRTTHYSSAYGVPFDGTAAHPEGVRIEMEKETWSGQVDLRPESTLLRGVLLRGGVTRYQHREIEGESLIGTEYGIVTTVADATLDHSIAGRAGPSGLLKLGVEHVDFVANGLLIDPSIERTFYGVLHEHLELGTLELAASLRLDRVGTTSTPSDGDAGSSRSFLGLSGGVGAEYHLLPSLSLSGHLLRSFRAPSINELLSRGPHAANYAFEIGNDRLEAERGLGTEIAVEYEEGAVEGELRLYSYHFDSYIIAQPTGDTNRASGLAVYRFENSQARLLGFEWHVEVRPIEELLVGLDASGTWGTRANLRDDGEVDAPLREIPPLSINAELRWDEHPWSAGLRSRTFTAQGRLGAFETETPGGTSLGLHLRRSFQLGSTIHALQLTVENLLDADLRDHLSRTKEVYAMAGRDIGVSWRVSW